MRKFIIRIILSFASTLLFAQLQNMDSLRRQLTREKKDRGMYILYVRMAEHYYYANADSSIAYSKLAAQIAKKLNITLIEAYSQPNSQEKEQDRIIYEL